MSVVPKLSLRVVSLADSAARRAAVAENLGASGLDWAFFDACRADTPSLLDVDAGAQRDSFGRALTGAEIGCFKSHAAVLAAFDEDPALDWLMVAEDDVWIDTDFAVPSCACWMRMESRSCGSRRWNGASRIPG
ncbi:MAG: glycosyltransferase family 25 protein [Paracoccaceae bacterium]